MTKPAMEMRQTSTAVTALSDVVLPLPEGLNDRQLQLAKAALANIPRPPRLLPPRLVSTEGFQIPVVGSVAALWPGLVQRLRRDTLQGARGIAKVHGVSREIDLRGNSRNFFWVVIEYVVDGEPYKRSVRASEGDAADADNARVVPVVVDTARPQDVIVWWSALDVR